MDFENITTKKHHTKVLEYVAEIQSFGLLMVKPHATLAGLNIPIIKLLSEHQETVNYFFSQNSRLTENLKLLKVCKVIAKDLSTENPTNKNILNTFYGFDMGERYYPILMEKYAGPINILILRYAGIQEDLHTLLKQIKGYPKVLTPEGDIAIQPSGIRGKFIPASIIIEQSYLQGLDDQRYRNTISPIIQNVVHTTDSEEETARALYYILSDYDIEEMNERGIDIRKFIDKYFPRNITINYEND